MKVVGVPSFLLLVLIHGFLPFAASLDARGQRRHLDMERKGGGGKGKGRNKKDDCTRIEFFSDNALYGAAIQGNAIGSTVADLPIFSRTDDPKEIGLFTFVSTDLSNDGGSSDGGFVTLYDDNGGVAGTVFYSGGAGNDFAITGGIGKYACAQGILQFQGFEENKFNLDVVLCGGFCNP